MSTRMKQAATSGHGADDNMELFDIYENSAEPSTLNVSVDYSRSVSESKDSIIPESGTKSLSNNKMSSLSSFNSESSASSSHNSEPRLNLSNNSLRLLNSDFSWSGILEKKVSGSLNLNSWNRKQCLLDVKNLSYGMVYTSHGSSMPSIPIRYDSNPSFLDVESNSAWMSTMLKSFHFVPLFCSVVRQKTLPNSSSAVITLQQDFEVMQRSPLTKYDFCKALDNETISQKDMDLDSIKCKSINVKGKLFTFRISSKENDEIDIMSLCNILQSASANATFSAFKEICQLPFTENATKQNLAQRMIRFCVSYFFKTFGNMDFIMEMPLSFNESVAKFYPLHETVKSLNYSILEALLSYSWEPEMELEAFIKSQNAVEKVSIVSFLKKKKLSDTDIHINNEINWKCIDFNYRDDKGLTPLHIMFKTLNSTQSQIEQNSSNEILKIIRLLLLHGADPNIANSEGKSCLHYSGFVSLDYIKVILKNGGKIDLEDNSCNTPFDEWCRYGNYEVLSYILDSNNFDYPDEIKSILVEVSNRKNWTDGSNPLFLAISNGHFNCVNLLLRINDINVNSRDFRRNSPLLKLCQEYVARVLLDPLATNVRKLSTEISTCLSLMIAKKADVNAVNFRGKSAFMELCRVVPHESDDLQSLYSAPLFKMLIINNAVVESISQSGFTPLHYAAMAGNWRVVELLLTDKSSGDPANDLLKSFSSSEIANFKRKQIVDVNIRSGGQFTALDLTISRLSEFQVKESKTHDKISKNLKKTIEILRSFGCLETPKLKSETSSSSEIIFAQVDYGGHPEVVLKAGSLKGIVNYIVARDSNNNSRKSYFERIYFIMLHHTVSTFKELMACLLEVTKNITNDILSSDLDNNSKGSNVQSALKRICEFILYWIFLRRTDFESMPSQISPDELSEFISSMNDLLLLVTPILNQVYLAMGNEPISFRISSDSFMEDVDYVQHSLAEFVKQSPSSIDIKAEQHSPKDYVNASRRSGGALSFYVPTSNIRKRFTQSVAIDDILPVKSVYFSDDNISNYEDALKNYDILYNKITGHVRTDFTVDENLVKSVISNQNSSKTLWGMSAVEVAQQLTMLIHCLLRNIPTSELTSAKFMDPVITPNFNVLKTVTNKLNFIFISEILKHENPLHRAYTILFFVSVAENCIRLKNLETVLMIVSCLEVTPIYRLRQTWALVEKEAPGRWLALKSFVGIGGRSLINFQSTLQSPFIPSVSIVLRLLINIGEEPTFVDPVVEAKPRLQRNQLAALSTSTSIQPTTTKRPVSAELKNGNTNKFINFQKITKIGEVLGMLVKSCEVLYPFSVDSNFLDTLISICAIPATFPGSAPSSRANSTTVKPSPDNSLTSHESISSQSNHERKIRPYNKHFYSNEDECYHRSVMLERNDSSDNAIKYDTLRNKSKSMLHQQK